MLMRQSVEEGRVRLGRTGMVYLRVLEPRVAPGELTARQPLPLLRLRLSSSGRKLLALMLMEAERSGATNGGLPPLSSMR